MRRVALVLVGAAVLALPACDSDSSGGSGATTTGVA
ncbi:MAG TPA: peptidylprolyl isomerase, partial [Acidimicrobiaceae bacterium]|nr:peptidylprolyl isomerase [Acidimicrobiaceae bacterium]